MMLAACDGATDSCPVAGDPSQPIAADPFVMAATVDGGIAAVPLGDGGPIPLLVPQQGGYVVYAGARLKNLDACRVTVAGELVDPTTGAPTTNRDTRQTDLIADGSGWWAPARLDSLSTVPNIPTCPDALGVGVVDKPARLRLVVTDRHGRSATFEVPVVPRCADDERHAFCECTCGPDYHPGKCALPDADAGVSDMMAVDGGGG